MKKLRYIYILLTAALLGFLSFACTDEDIEQSEGDEAAINGQGGGFITSTIKVSAVAPEITADLETRAGTDNANIEHDRPENGGRFQNVVVVLTNDNDTVYGIHCNKWYGEDPTSTGVKQYEYIFQDMKVYTNGGKAKVYAFGNVDNTHYETISGYTVGDTRKKIDDASYYSALKELIEGSISVDEANLYKISFEPGSVNYKINDSDVVCTGMPVNGDSTATITKGATHFTVHMKRVCARLQVTFRNMTGTYKDYYKNGTETPNNVYVDKFILNNVLLTSSNYYCNKSTSLTPGNVSFNILKALGGQDGTNDHVINKIENGKDTTISMYVFENKKGTGTEDYKYDLKVDRGKSLGTNTTVIDTANAYVIWNNGNGKDFENRRSLALGDEGKIKSSKKQESYDKIPFKDQVFWQFVVPKIDHSDNVYALKHYKVDVDLDMHIISNCYFPAISSTYIDWGIIGLAYNYKHVDDELTNVSKMDDAQYIQFVRQNETDNEFTMNLLNKNTGLTKNYYEKKYMSERRVMLTLCENNQDDSDKNKLSTLRADFWEGNKLGNYDWTLYAKYIIKNGAIQENGKDLTQITRNNSYELEYNVMPNYDDEVDLQVKCVRNQTSIVWESTDK